MEKIPLLTKDYFYKLAEDSSVIHHCIMDYEHRGLTWEAALAKMVYFLNESNKKKDEIIHKNFSLMPIPKL